VIDTYDAAVVTKDDSGKVRIVKKVEEPTRHGAVAGLVVGLAVGALVALFPAVAIGAGLAVGGATGATIGAVPTDPLVNRRDPQADGRPSGRQAANRLAARITRSGVKPVSRSSSGDPSRKASKVRTGARGGSRTPTPFRAPDPKSGASAIPPLSRLSL
jgi:hypothetical protein